MSDVTKYIALDVHKEMIAVAEGEHGALPRPGREQR